MVHQTQFLCPKVNQFITLKDCVDCSDKDTCDRLKYEKEFEEKQKRS